MKAIFATENRFLCYAGDGITASRRCSCKPEPEVRPINSEHHRALPSKGYQKRGIIKPYGVVLKLSIIKHV